MGEIGLSPKEFYCMTEHEYYKICIGHKNKILNELRLHRQLAYFTAVSSMDPKKIPSIEKFMPLDGDAPAYTPPSIDKLREWDKKYRSIK